MARPREAFAGNGDRLVRFPGQGVDHAAVISSLAATRDGGLLFTIDSEGAPDDFPAPASRVDPRVVLAERPTSKRLAVALTRGTLRAGRRMRVGWRSTRPARLRLVLRAGVQRRPFATRTIRARELVGHAAIRWPLRPGRLYQVTADASVAGQTAHDELWVIPGGRAEIAAARAFAATDTFHGDELDERLGRCLSEGARRVDCVIDDPRSPDPRGDPDRRCARVLAVTVRRNGQVWLADRHCPLRAHTRLSAPWPARHPIAHSTR